MGSSQALCDLDEIAGVERHDDGVAGRFMERGAGGEALAHQYRAGCLANLAADDEQPAGGRQIGAEQLVSLSVDRLQRLDLAVRPMKGNENVGAIDARAIGPDALGRQVGMAGVGWVRCNPAFTRLAHRHIAPLRLFGLEPCLAGFEFGHAISRHDWECPARQALGSSPDVEPLDVLKEVENVAVRGAAIAMVALILRIDGE
nr:hypothetical protein [Novosphingobium sp. ST904]